MATLTDEQKFRVVHLLATFRTPTQVQQALKEEFKGLEASLPQIMFYDPNTAQGSRQLSEEWKSLFRETRRRYIDGVTEIGIANQAYRLERLQELLGHQLVKASPGMVRATLEQAAKEVGGMFQRPAEKDGGSGQDAAEGMIGAFGKAIDKIYGEKPSFDADKAAPDQRKAAPRQEMGGASGDPGAPES